MATATRVCRVCGKEYEACHDLSRPVGVFRWQDVSCSPECGEIYLRQLNEARGIITPDKDEAVVVKSSSVRRRIKAQTCQTLADLDKLTLNQM